MIKRRAQKIASSIVLVAFLIQDVSFALAPKKFSEDPEAIQRVDSVYARIAIHRKTSIIPADKLTLDAVYAAAVKCNLDVIRSPDEITVVCQAGTILRYCLVDGRVTVRGIFPDDKGDEGRKKKLASDINAVSAMTEPVIIPGVIDGDSRLTSLRINKDMLDLIHPEDIAGIKRLVSKNPNIEQNKRTGFYRLKHPFTVKWGADNVTINNIYAKGVLFDSKRKLRAHYGSGFPKYMIVVTPDGRLSIKHHPTGPEGACLLAEAEREFLIMSDMHADPYFRENDIMPKFPVGVARFPGIFYEFPDRSDRSGEKEEVGAILYGTNNFQNLRYGKISPNQSENFLDKDGPKAGSMLSAMHKRGITQRWLHSDNYMIFDKIKVPHDLGLSKSISRDKLEPGIYIAEILGDLYYAVMQLDETEGAEYAQAFTKGYFGDFAEGRNMTAMIREVFRLGKDKPVYDIDHPLVKWLKDNIVDKAFGVSGEAKSEAQTKTLTVDRAAMVSFHVWSSKMKTHLYKVLHFMDIFASTVPSERLAVYSKLKVYYKSLEECANSLYEIGLPQEISDGMMHDLAQMLQAIGVIPQEVLFKAALLCDDVRGDKMFKVAHEGIKNMINMESLASRIHGTFIMARTPSHNRWRIDLEASAREHQAAVWVPVKIVAPAAELLDKVYIEDDMAVKSVVNPDDKPLTGIYGAAGTDISNFLLSTNASRGIFIARYKGLKKPDLERAAQLFESFRQAKPVNADYVFGKKRSGYGVNTGTGWGIANITEQVAYELAFLDVDGVKVKEDSKGRPEIVFMWAYPGQPKRERVIKFVDADMKETAKYADILEETVHIYYQRAAEDLPGEYAKSDNYISRIADSLEDGGYLVTDDYTTAGGHFRRPADFPLALSEMAVPGREGRVPVVYKLRYDPSFHEGEGPDSLWFHYGWRVAVRQKGFSSDIKSASPGMSAPDSFSSDSDGGDIDNPFIRQHIASGRVVEVSAGGDINAVTLAGQMPRAPPIDAERNLKEYDLLSRIGLARDPELLKSIIDERPNFRYLSADEKERLVTLAGQISITIHLDDAWVVEENRRMLGCRVGWNKRLLHLGPTIHIGELLLREMDARDIAQVMLEEGQHIVKRERILPDGTTVNLDVWDSTVTDPYQMIHHDTVFMRHVYDLILAATNKRRYSDKETARLSLPWADGGTHDGKIAAPGMTPPPYERNFGIYERPSSTMDALYEGSKSAAPGMKAPKNFIFAQDISILDIQRYISEIIQRVSSMSREEFMLSRMKIMDDIRGVVDGLTMIRYGRTKKHEPCLNCINGGGCAMLDGMLAGLNPKDIKEHKGCSTKCRISDSDLTEAIDELNIFIGIFGSANDPMELSLDFAQSTATSESFPSAYRAFNSEKLEKLFKAVMGQEVSGERLRFTSIFDRLNTTVRDIYLIFADSGKRLYPCGCGEISAAVCQFLRDNGFEAFVRSNKANDHFVLTVRFQSGPAGKPYYFIFDYTADQFLQSSERARVSVSPVVIPVPAVAGLDVTLRNIYDTDETEDYTVIIPDDEDDATRRVYVELTKRMGAPEGHAKSAAPGMKAPGAGRYEKEIAKIRSITRQAIGEYLALGHDITNFAHNHNPGGRGAYWASSYDDSIMLLAYAGAKNGDTILDVGHGAGDTVSFLSHIFGLKGKGVEVVKEHNDFAVFLRDFMVRKGYLEDGQVDLENKEFQDPSVDFSKYDFIYYFCRGTKDKKDLLTKLLTVKPGAKILMYGSYEPYIERKLTEARGFKKEIFMGREDLGRGTARIYTRVGPVAVSPKKFPGADPRAFLKNVHNLTRKFIKDHAMAPGSRIILSETLFTASDAEQLRSILRAKFADKSPVLILPADKISAAVNKNPGKGSVGCVLGKDDYDDPKLWNKRQEKATVLVLGQKLDGDRYLHVEGVVGLVYAMMAGDAGSDAVNRYIKLIFKKVDGLDAAELAELLVKDPRGFADKVRFKPVDPADVEGLDQKNRIAVETYLVSA